MFTVISRPFRKCFSRTMRVHRHYRITIPDLTLPRISALSQKRLKATAAAAGTEVAMEPEATSSTDGGDLERSVNVPTAKVDSGKTTDAASGVAVEKYAGNSGGRDDIDGGGRWLERPKRPLLVIIHPWCMFRKSGTDRQSEFPPPGFLNRLKAKLLALHRDADEQQRHASTAAVKRRRNNSQKIKYWIQYAAAAYQNEPLRPPVFVDFLAVRRRFATIASTIDNADGCQRQKRTSKNPFSP